MVRANPCLSCGACCAYYRVSFHWSEAEKALGGTVPASLTEELTPFLRCMAGTNQKHPRCVALRGVIGRRVRCRIHARRPSTCREFGPAWESGAVRASDDGLARCNAARAAWGLVALEPGAQEARRRRAPLLRREGVILGLVLGVALLVRLWRLGTVPDVINGDEAGAILHPLQILHGQTGGIFRLTHDGSVSYLAFASRALVLAILGPGQALLAARLVVAVLSVVALVPFFALLRRHANLLVSALMTVALAASYWYLNFSRVSWIAVDSVCLGLWLLFLLERMLGRGRAGDFALGGLVAGLALYSYMGGRIYVVACGLTLLVWMVRARSGSFWGRLKRVGLWGLVAVVVFLPQVPALAADWDDYTLRARRLYAFAPNLATDQNPSYYGHRPTETVPVLLHQVAYALRGFLLFDPAVSAEGPENWRLVPPGRPAVGEPIAWLFWLGLAVADVRRKGSLAWWLVYGLNLLLLQIPSIFVPSWSRGLGALPVIYLFAGLAVEEACHLARGRRWRWVAAVVSLALVLQAARDVSIYWRWARSDEYRRAQQPAIRVEEVAAWQRAETSFIAAGKAPFTFYDWQNPDWREANGF